MRHDTLVPLQRSSRSPQTTSTRGDVAVRVDGHRVRTAVWILVHPGTGRTVTLVGTMHIGDAGYFEALSELLAGLAAAGTEIHVEGIARRDGDDPTEWERDRLAEAEGWANPERSGAAVALLHLESQAELRLPGGTRNVDLSHLQLLRRVGWEGYRHLLAPQPESPLTAGLGPLIRTVLRFQLRHNRSFELLHGLRAGNRLARRVVLRERNGLAFAGAADALERGDVALVWGPDHLPGLARLFAAAGYRRRRELWFEACTI